MRRTLIIGYGNPLRSDDGVGYRAAGLLAEAQLPDGVEVMACHQLNVELAPLIAGVARLILIDACAFGEPGTITAQALTPKQITHSSLSHHVDAPGLLAMAQILYDHVPPTILLTVSGGSFDYGEAFTPPVAAAVPALLARVWALLEH